ILQALHLMNGKPMADAIDLDLNRALRILAEARGQTTAQRIEELYLTTLSRRPLPAETERLVKYVEQGGPRKDQRKALSDVLWALLNAPDFFHNHCPLPPPPRLWGGGGRKTGAPPMTKTPLPRRDWLRLVSAGAVGVPLSGWLAPLAADA